MQNPPTAARILLAALAILITLGVAQLHSSPPEQWQPLLARVERSLQESEPQLAGSTASGGAGQDEKTRSANQPRLLGAANQEQARTKGQAPLRPKWAGQAEMAAVAGLGMIMAIILPLAPYRWGFTATLLLGFGLIAFNRYYIKAARGWELSSFYPLLGLVLIYLLITLVRLAIELAYRRRMQRALSQQLSESSIERIIDKPDSISLEAQRREVSIISLGLAGFGPVSDELSPEGFAGFLRQYTSEMNHIIMDEAGTVDWIQGDVIMAFWNAPLDQPDHAVRAVRAALRCQERMAKLKDGFSQIIGAEPDLRVGIHTARAVVGELGSTRGTGYTVLGGAVKLAARLRQANLLFATPVLMSQEVWQLTEGRFEGRELGEIQFAGLKKPVTVVEPLGHGGRVDLEPYEPFLQGLEKLRQKDLVAALRILEKLEHDPVARVYARKLRKLAIDGDTWNGIWRQIYI